MGAYYWLRGVIVQAVGRLLVVAGLVLVLAGSVVLLLARFWPGRLPGDIVIRRDHVTIFVPLVTSLLLSLLLTGLLWLLRR